MLPIFDILKHYDHDYVILEGVTDCNVPRIITAHKEQAEHHGAKIVTSEVTEFKLDGYVKALVTAA